MNKNLNRIILSIFLPIALGCGAILPVVNSENGYVAGYVFFPLFLLIGLATLCLLIAGLIYLVIETKLGGWILLAAFLLPASFISSASIAKYFEIGAYRQEPMISFDDEMSNIILLKEGTNNDQIEDFWHKTLLIEESDEKGYKHRTGIGTIGRIQSRNGHEAIAFGFFPNATEEQKQIVFEKVKYSPIVYELLENQSVKEWNATSENSPPVNSNVPLKKVVINSANSKNP